MGKKNDALLTYLEDNARFADLFNYYYFGGMQVVKPQELREASEVYVAVPDEKDGQFGQSGQDGKDGKGRESGKGRQSGRGRQSGQRIRDIKKRLESGGWLRILAVEAQYDIAYCMPWRIMEYDCREYGQQIRRIQRQNQEADLSGEKKVYANAGERLGKFRKEDRIAPVYTLCLYHGVEEWDGPRCLKDMIDFGTAGPGEERHEWEKWFADYPMRLVCANEPGDGAGFQTSLGILFALLPLRKNKAALRSLLEKDPVYRQMDEETADTVGILMGVKGFMENRKKYKEGEGYNMCQAIREMMEDSRVEGEKIGRMEGEKIGRIEGEKAGWKEGEKAGREEEQKEGIRIFIQSHRDDGTEEEAIADKLQKYYAKTAEDAWSLLNNSKNGQCP